MKRLYAAYGSNLNITAMRERCPSAVIVGTAQLADTALEYRGSAPHVYLTITEKKGATTPLGIWSVTESDEAQGLRISDLIRTFSTAPQGSNFRNR